MKSTFHWVLAIGVLVVIIVGVTFISHFNWNLDNPNKGGSPKNGEGTKGQFLIFVRADEDAGSKSDQTGGPKAEEGRHVPEYEVRKTYHHDTWFRNPNPGEVQMALAEKGCACSGVQVGKVPPGELKEWRTDWLTTWAAASLFPGGLGAEVIGPAAVAALPGKFQWTKIEDNAANAAAVPAGAEGDPAPGVVRVEWTGKDLGPVNLKADLLIRMAGKEGVQRELINVPNVIVVPVMVYPAIVQVPDLGQRDVREGQFVCWSSTRKSFTVEVHEKDRHPCFECQAVPIKPQEFPALEQELLKGQGARTRVLAAYRITVRVHERRGDEAQLDLGPFQRQLVIKHDGDGEPMNVTVTGTVRGDITLITRDNKEIIDLGQYPASRGREPVRVVVATDQLGTKLTLDQVSPTFLDVELTEAGTGQRRWNLEVSVKPNKPSGRLPTGSSIILKAEGADGSTRKIRIPVTGTAYR